MNASGLAADMPKAVLEHELRGAIEAWPRSSFGSTVNIDCECGFDTGDVLLADVTQRLLSARCRQCGRFIWIHRVVDPSHLDEFMRDEANCRLLALWIADAKHDAPIVAERAGELLALVKGGMAPSDALAERRRQRGPLAHY